MHEVGFTGTRQGMTDAQREAFGNIIKFNYPPCVFHHGACKGADAQAASLVRASIEGVVIVAHPGKSAKGGDNEWLDVCAVMDADEIRETKTHFARNRDIVDGSDVLIACPPCNPLPSSGGTLYTIHYAKECGRRVVIVWPDGTSHTDG